MYHTLMVPLDGSSFGEYALPLALGIAQQAGARLQLTHVRVPPPHTSFADGTSGTAHTVEAADQVYIQRYLVKLAQELSEGWDVVITTIVLGGPVADTLYQHALAGSVDLVVMTTHGHGPLLFGYAPEALAPGLNQEILAQRQAAAQGYLEHVAERMRAQDLQVRTEVMIAPPAVAILGYACEHAVDQIALATHGCGGARMLLGSVADKIVRGAGAPILL